MIRSKLTLALLVWAGLATAATAQQQPSAAEQARGIAAMAAQAQQPAAEGPACPGARVTTRACVFQFAGAKAGRVTAAANSTAGHIGAASAICMDGRLNVKEVVCESGDRASHPRLGAQMDEILASATEISLDTVQPAQVAAPPRPQSNNIAGTALTTTQPVAVYAAPTPQPDPYICNDGVGNFVSWSAGPHHCSSATNEISAVGRLTPGIAGDSKWFQQTIGSMRGSVQYHCGSDGRWTITDQSCAPLAGAGGAVPQSAAAPAPAGPACDQQLSPRWSSPDGNYQCEGSHDARGYAIREGGAVTILNTVDGLDGNITATCRGGAIEYRTSTATCRSR